MSATVCWLSCIFKYLITQFGSIYATQLYATFALYIYHIMKKLLLPITLVFISITCICILAANAILKYNLSQQVLLYGNIILYGITILASLFYYKAIHNPSTFAFVRGVYASLLCKMLVVMASIFMYVQYTKAPNKASIAILMALYLVYTTVEVLGLYKINKLKPHA